MARTSDMGVDGIILDHPDPLRRVAGEKGHRVADGIAGGAVAAGAPLNPPIQLFRRPNKPRTWK
jgi:hypothetical protein